MEDYKVETTFKFNKGIFSTSAEENRLACSCLSRSKYKLISDDAFVLF